MGERAPAEARNTFTSCGRTDGTRRGKSECCGVDARRAARSGLALALVACAAQKLALLVLAHLLAALFDDASQGPPRKMDEFGRLNSANRPQSQIVAKASDAPGTERESCAPGEQLLSQEASLTTCSLRSRERRYPNQRFRRFWRRRKPRTGFSRSPSCSSSSAIALHSGSIMSPRRR